MQLYLPSTENAQRVKKGRVIKMKLISEKLTHYIIRSGVVSPESYAVYQYGFQVGLEAIFSFTICCIIAALSHMILEFIVFTVIFMLLRTYAGGVHLKRFISCLFCSVCVQTSVLLLYHYFTLPVYVSFVFIILCSIVIVKKSPVESDNKELSYYERKLFKDKTKKVVVGIILFTVLCSFMRKDRIVFLVALVFLVVMISQYIGVKRNSINYDK